MLTTTAAVRTAAAAALDGPVAERTAALAAVVADVAPELMAEAVAAGAFGGDAFPAMLADALEMLDDAALATWVRAVL